MSRSRHLPGDIDGTRDEGFLRRWSRRKQGVPAEAEVPAEPIGATGSPPPPPAEPVKTDADMPPLDSIDEQSNVSDFLSPGVSEALRTAALRRLFRMPKFNVVDGLDDYCDDFTKFEPLGDIITADMRHRIEMAAERAKQRTEQWLADATESEQGADAGAPQDAPESGADGDTASPPSETGEEDVQT